MSIFRSLYRGETRINFIGSRRRWYFASFILLLLCVFSFVFRGFNYGVEFAGGTQYRIQVANTHISTAEANTAFSDAGTAPSEPPQEVGSGSTRVIVVQTETVTPAQQTQVTNDVAKDLNLATNKFNVEAVSSSWGHSITVKAIEGLIVFLIVVSIYISLRFQWRMAVGGMVALLHDLVITAGVYSIVGFQVTPSTVVGLLTILGFSLYDTVVVYDKVAENSRNILGGSRMTFSEAANLAVNQTLMRSINTSLIALLPVAGLLFVGAGILGVGTIKDLALILFVGLATGAYSSLFLATPIVVELTEREPAYKALTKRVVAKRASEARKLGEPVAAGGVATLQRGPSRPTGGGGAPAPRPGAKPRRRRK
jgi:preprotein translocase subunit SecF